MTAGEPTANANSNRRARTRLEAATVKLIRKQSFRATSVDQIARAASTYANDLLPALQEQERSHPLSTAIVHSRDPDFCDQSNAHIDQRTARRPAQFLICSTISPTILGRVVFATTAAETACAHCFAEKCAVLEALAAQRAAPPTTGREIMNTVPSYFLSA